jgi:hypothetical protein
MNKAETRQGLPIGARIAVAGLCWLAVLGPKSIAEPLREAGGRSGFHLAVAESTLGRGTKAGFDLGLDEDVGAGENPFSAPIAPFQRGTRNAFLERAFDWDGRPPAPEAESQSISPDTERTERVPEKPFGWKQFRFDLSYVARKPAHLDAREKRVVVGVAGTTGLLYVFRKDIQEAWHENSSESRTDFLDSARFMGGAAFAPSVALAAYLASFVTHNEREKETAQLVLESMALSGLGATIGQFVLATERPEDGDAIRFFHTDGHGVSGDVAFAASIIPPLRRQYLRVRPEDSVGRRILKHGISALLYSGMVFTALQRIDADQHWAPDVFLGMVMGLGVGRTLGQAHDEAHMRRSRLAFSVLPRGVAVTWTLSLDSR